MAFDTYVKIDGIPGESTSKGFEKQIEIMSFSLGVSNTHTISSASGGAGSGRASFHSFSMMKKTDKTSPLLFVACASGEHIKSIVVTMRKTGGKSPVNFLVYTFSDCTFDSVQWSGSTGGDDSPTESVSFGYSKVEVSYTPQKADGSGDAAIMKHWDLKANSAA